MTLELRNYLPSKLISTTTRRTMPKVKPLFFKGDKKPKKRKRVDVEEKFGDETTGKEISKVEEDAPADDDR